MSRIKVLNVVRSYTMNFQELMGRLYEIEVTVDGHKCILKTVLDPKDIEVDKDCNLINCRVSRDGRWLITKPKEVD